MNRKIVQGVLLSSVSLAAAEPPCLSYDAGLGTAPDSQGWDKTVVDPASFDVTGGVLHQSTLPFSINGCLDGQSEPQLLFWSAPVEPFTFSEGVVLEAELRVLSSQYAANPCNDWPRPGFLMGVDDESDRTFRVGFGESTILLENDPFIPFGSPGVVEASFDTTDDFHSYRLEIVGAEATLSIDGVPTLSLSFFGNPFSTSNRVFFGDGTGWANSEVEIRAVRVFPLGDEDCGPCPADFNGDGLVNVLDFIAFQGAFAAMDPAADCNGDTMFNILDFVCFQATFAAGCP